MTLQDVREQWEAIRKHPDFDPNFTYLTDLTGVTQYTISTTELKQLVATSDPFSRDSRRIVVAHTDYLFGMVRMYELSGDKHPRLSVVRTKSEAVNLIE